MRGRHVTVLAVFLAVGLLAGAGSQGAASGPAAVVPAPYQGLYRELEAKLGELEQKVDRVWGGTPQPVVFTAELMPANPNRGEDLLRPENLKAVYLYLNRLQGLGFTGVTVGINYPLLMPWFPRFNEYLRFYRAVAAEVHRRGLKLIVETTTIFPDPEFSSLGVKYQGLTVEQFYKDKRQMAELILKELKPDYLTLDSELLTQQRNTGLRLSVSDYVRGVNSILAGLDRTGVRIGAGGGSWDDPAVFERLARETSLDYLDVHVYPIQRDFLWDRIPKIGRLARENGKGLTVGESWLYKTAERELGKSAATEADIFGRDVWSFWAPLDQRFLGIMVKLAQVTKMEFCSFFWTEYLFGYAEYGSETKNLDYRRLMGVANRAAWGNITKNQPSPTGRYLKGLLPISAQATAL